MPPEGEGATETLVLLMSEGKGVARGGQPCFGLWLVTSRIQQPRTTRGPVKGWMDSDKGKESCPSSLDPYSSSPSWSSPTTTISSPNLPPNSDGWQKPSKVARHHLLEVVGDPGKGPILPSVFCALDPLGDSMEVGLGDEASPHDLQMVNYGAGSLKRG